MNFFFSSRRRHTRWPRDWSSDVCSSDLSKIGQMKNLDFRIHALDGKMVWEEKLNFMNQDARIRINLPQTAPGQYFYTLRAGSSLIASGDRKSTRLNSSHVAILYAVFCLKEE